jgi:hypothetical protein
MQSGSLKQDRSACSSSARCSRRTPIRPDGHSDGPQKPAMLDRAALLGPAAEASVGRALRRAHAADAAVAAALVSWSTLRRRDARLHAQPPSHVPLQQSGPVMRSPTGCMPQLTPHSCSASRRRRVHIDQQNGSCRHRVHACAAAVRERCARLADRVRTGGRPPHTPFALHCRCSSRRPVARCRAGVTPQPQLSSASWTQKSSQNCWQ